MGAAAAAAAVAAELPAAPDSPRPEGLCRQASVEAPGSQSELQPAAAALHAALPPCVATSITQTALNKPFMFCAQ